MNIINIIIKYIKFLFKLMQKSILFCFHSLAVKRKFSHDITVNIIIIIKGKKRWKECRRLPNWSLLFATTIKHTKFILHFGKCFFFSSSSIYLKVVHTENWQLPLFNSHSMNTKEDWQQHFFFACRSTSSSTFVVLTRFLPFLFVALYLYVIIYV